MPISHATTSGSSTGCRCLLPTSTTPDKFRLARIRRERQQATQRLTEDQDTAAWKATWDRLNLEEAEAQAVSATPVAAQDVAESLSDLQSLFADAEPLTRHRIVQALFEKMEVLGPNEIWLYASVEAEARGWAGAMHGTNSADGTVVRFVRPAEQEAMNQSAAS